MSEQPQTSTSEPASAPSLSRRLPWQRSHLLIFTILGVLALDQLTKYLIRSYLELGESWPAEGFVRLTHGTNSGTAFGLFPNQTFILILASLIAIGFLYYFYRSQAGPRALLRFTIGLQLGGAFGNLIDRVRDGAVVDFIDIGPWPIFNVADSSIVVGISLLVWTMLIGGGRPASPAEDSDRPEDSGSLNP